MPKFITYILGLPKRIGLLLALILMALGVMMLGVAYTTPLGGAFSNTAIFLLGFVFEGVGGFGILYIMGVR